MTTANSSQQNVGQIVQVIGPTVDVRFPGKLPDILNAVTIENHITKETIVCEAAQHLGNNLVRSSRWPRRTASCAA